VGKGVVGDPDDRREAILGVAEEARGLGLAVLGFAASGLPGPKGNRETFVHCALGAAGLEDLAGAIEEVQA
jgi:23S rRNA (cytidine1920-2'-O)/16S rRNA (cytidine1409-2'-O)-methyltransferase